MSGSTRRAVAPWAFGLGLLAAWVIVVEAAAPPPYMLPSPMAVVQRLGAALTSPAFWPAVGATFAEAVGGSLLGAVVALPLAIAIHRSRLLGAAVAPFLGATQAIPAIALAPLLAIWVGSGLGPIVLLCGLMVFFPILVSSVVGLRHVDDSIVDAARIDGAGTVALLSHIELPLALPNILAGLRNIVGGEIHEYGKLIAESREQALDRMAAEAQSLGANAIITTRFTTSVLAAGAAELLAVGTAVVIEPE